MAITPRSKGLGNIGSIVNRQRMASPTRPAAKPVAKMPVPKPVAPKTTVNPFAGGKTTTAAQRQAMSPFRSATKPVAKVNPLQAQYDQMKNTPMAPPPGGFQMMPFNPNPTIPPNTMYNPTPEDMARFGTPTQPFNPTQNPGIQMRLPVERPQPFNPQPTPGQMPLDQLIRPEVGRDQYEVQREVEAMMNGGYSPRQQSFPGLSEADMINNWLEGERSLNDPNFMNQFNQGSGIFGGIMPMDNQAPMTNNQIGPSFNVGGATMGRFADFNPTMDFIQANNSYVDPFGPAGLKPSNSYMDPNLTIPSDYDQLEGSAFNTNPSNSGSLFSGGGFAGK